MNLRRTDGADIPTTEAAAREIESFVRQRFQIPDDDFAFDPKVNLWEEGYVDSLGVVEMIEFLERQFAVHLPEDVLFCPEFTSIDGMARTIVKLKAG